MVGGRAPFVTDGLKQFARVTLYLKKGISWEVTLAQRRAMVPRQSLRLWRLHNGKRKISTKALKNAIE